MKKVLALALALVMVLCLSVSAFAAPASTATIVVNYGGEDLLNETVTLTAGMTVKDILDMYADDLELEWDTVANLNPYFGDTAYIVNSIYGVGSEPLGAASGLQAQFWSSAYPGYGIKTVRTVDGETVYDFIYAGNDWVFTVGGEKPVDERTTNPTYELYVDQYTVQAGDEIALTYQLVTEEWSGTTNWLGGV